MEDAEIYSKLTGVFHQVFDDDSIELTPTLSAKDVEGWDSLTHVRLVLTVERTFKTRFSTMAIGKLKDVGDLVALVKSSKVRP
jgi:acyl carrier protein